MLAALFCIPGAFAEQTFRNDYTVTPVNTVTPLTVLASSSTSIIRASIFDSSGKTLELLVDGSRRILIPPGGVDCSVGIAKGALVQLRAISASATSGEIDINFF